MEVLWLSEEDVKGLLTMDEAMEAVEEAFKEHGLKRTQMPPKAYLYYHRYQGDLRTMPAYLEEADSTGVKIVNVHPGNVDKGLPTVMATMILNSPQTGAPLAVMGGTYLTSMRTGAAGGLAARLLAREDSRIVGLLGAGVQARTQLQALARIFSLELVKVFDISLERSQSLEKDCRAFLDCSYHVTMDPGEVCDCDILVTTTPSRRPVVRDHWVKDGTHINAIGADAKGKQELDSSLLRRSKVVVDDRVQAVHSGEINVPIAQGEFSRDEIYAELGEIVAGKLPGRVDQKEITIFDSTGLAIQDVATASNVLLRAMTSGKGLKLRL